MVMEADMRGEGDRRRTKRKGGFTRGIGFMEESEEGKGLLEV